MNRFSGERQSFNPYNEAKGLPELYNEAKGLPELYTLIRQRPVWTSIDGQHSVTAEEIVQAFENYLHNPEEAQVIGIVADVAPELSETISKFRIKKRVAGINSATNIDEFYSEVRKIGLMTVNGRPGNFDKIQPELDKYFNGGSLENLKASFGSSPLTEAITIKAAKLRNQV